MKYQHNKGVTLSLTEKILITIALIVVVTFFILFTLAITNKELGVNIGQTIIAGRE